VSALLRGLPSVDALAKAIGDGDALCVGAARQVIEEVRLAVLSGDLAALPDVQGLATERLSVLRGGRLRRVLNATGVVLHTNLGRSEWSEAAQAAAVTAMGATNLEMWLSSGKRGGRTHGIDVLLRHLTGCEAGLVVNNCAAAVLLALTALAAGREVVVSRGELVEIGGSFRVPDVIASCGARLVEVGTTNRTRVADFAGAVGPQTAVLLRVHPSNFRVVGFTEAPDRKELAKVAKSSGVPLLEDLGAGSLDGRSGEPSVRQVLCDGVDLAMFSGDKLLGGPQAGVLVGRRDLIAALRTHPLYRALRVDKVTLAALEATLVGHATIDAVPTAVRLDSDPQVLWERAQRWVGALGALGVDAAAVRCDDAVGGGALPGQALAGAAVVLRGADAQRLATRLRTGRLAVIGRVHDDALWLHPRCVDPRDDDALMVLVAEAQGLR
jgi:L-seryl-tRNA(Ser) seleniumtransferase